MTELVSLRLSVRKWIFLTLLLLQAPDFHFDMTRLLGVGLYKYKFLKIYIRLLLRSSTKKNSSNTKLRAKNYVSLRI